MSHVRPAAGLVLGKFLPVHAGHLHLIRTAAVYCEQLTVLVCTLERDPIPGEIRAAWMRELTAQIGPNIRVVHCAEDVPQAPDEDPRFWEVWTELCWRYAGHVDVVFTSEEYGDELARVLGARHHLVDLQRHTFSVSGTAVRADPFTMWTWLPQPVRAYYAARIALVGPQSSGKTTLAARLAAAYGTVWVPEYGREYVDERTAAAGSVDFTTWLTQEDFEEIAVGQAAREDTAARYANRVLFCDTDVTTTRVWSEVCLGQASSSLIAASLGREYDLHLFLHPDIPWTDDGTRIRPNDQQAHAEHLLSALRAEGRAVVEIRGTYGDRLTEAVAAIQSRWPTLLRIDTPPNLYAPPNELAQRRVDPTLRGGCKD